MSAKRRRLHFTQSISSESINISPLIDVVFILLIFFIVTTVFVDESGIDIIKPQASQAQTLEKNAIYIAISNDNQVYHANQIIGAKGVRSVVQRLLKKEALPVIIQADKHASIEVYTQVHNQALLAGATSIHLAANP